MKGLANALILTMSMLTNLLLAQSNELINIIRGPEDVLSSLTQAVELNSNNQRQLFRLYSQAAILLTDRGNYDLADSLYLKASVYEATETDSTYIFNMMISRALMNKIQSKPSKALDDYLKLLNHYESTNQVSGIVYTQARIAEFYRSRENGIKAQEYLDKAKVSVTKNRIDSAAVAFYYSRVAAIQNQFIGDMDSTIYYAKKGLEWTENRAAPHTRAMLLNELGYSYMHADISDSVTILNYYNESASIFFENGYFRDHITTLDNIALYYFRIDKPHIVIQILRNSTYRSEQNNWLTVLDRSYALLADNLRAVGEYEESNKYYQKAANARAENYRKQYVKEVNELEAIQDKENAEKALKVALDEAISKENRQQIAIFAAVLFTLLGGTAMFLFYRVRKNNKVLSAQQRTIEETNQELSNALTQKNVLYRELNHRVKNNLTVLSGLVYLQETTDAEGSDKALYQSLRHRIQSMALVHQNLYEFNEAVNLNFQQYLEQLISSIASAFSQGDKVNIEINCHELFADINEAVPLAMVINELVTNSFKHAFTGNPRDEIKLKSFIEGKNRIIYYSDNGPGLSDLNLEQAKSLGMRLVDLMIKQIKGTLIYEGNKNGVIFRIKLPEQTPKPLGLFD
jgi:two-component sensor histidine kinase